MVFIALNGTVMGVVEPKVTDVADPRLFPVARREVPGPPPLAESDVNVGALGVAEIVIEGPFTTSAFAFSIEIIPEAATGELKIKEVGDKIVTLELGNL